ncbi:hypothetical protein OIU77_024087 [Salix suchowensis]|uniref:Protein kinase domain-containing protein n=1 Tax=Salix suchowensis TaxID=1278906 RepID=A0ABQ9C9T6_9ROSI|nr:hypothetical protein OIU77_024087 [Salix suchowensis]
MPTVNILSSFEVQFMPVAAFLRLFTGLLGPSQSQQGLLLGLDLLVHTKHFHLGLNQLSGPIPPKLFSSEMKLIHVLLESNKLTGSIPSTLGLVKSLEVVRLDNNSLTGPVPTNINNLTSVNEMFLSNNGLKWVTSQPYWHECSHLLSLTTLVMQRTQLQGNIPPDFFSLSNLQTVDARNNLLNGTLDIGTSPVNKLAMIDLRKNQISAFTYRAGVEKVDIILVDNPICQETGATGTPNCKCALPYTGLLQFRAPSFSNLENNTYYTVLEKSLMNSFMLHQLPVDSVTLSYPRKDSSHYLVLNLQVFPVGQDRFNRTGISSIGFELSNQTFKPPPQFGPFFFIGDPYLNFAGEVTGSKKSSNTGVIIGAAAGGCVLLLLLLGAGLYAHRQKKRAEKATEQNNPFAHWESNKSIGGIPQLKGARNFSFEELRKYTNNFSEINDIGSGGYGNVYRGVLPTGELVAIKRAQQGSMQGGLEFKTEIELLSRVHHKNVVSLLGFCFDRGEQMLIYEFVPNGSLMDSLSGKTGIRLDWVRRLKVALGAARDSEAGHLTHVTTQVKGTMGYLDPEYYMTQQLTEKSDVYSFGVVMLELLTGRRPIERGKPTMGEVVKEIENILQLAGLNPNADSASTSASYDDASKGGAKHPYMYSKDAFDYSGGFPVPKLEPL